MDVKRYGQRLANAIKVNIWWLRGAQRPPRRRSGKKIFFETMAPRWLDDLQITRSSLSYVKYVNRRNDSLY